MTSSRTRPTNPWLDFQELFVPASELPPALRRKFWDSPLDYRDRLYFAAHGVQNGISPEIMVSVLRFTNEHFTEHRATEIKAVYAYLEGFTSVNRYCYFFAYHFIEKRVLCLNGHIRGDPACCRR